MIVYAKIVQLLKDWPFGCPVKPEWKRIEKEYLERGAHFAKSITLSEEARPDRLVFYIQGRRMDAGRGSWYRTKDCEIIAVWSYNHGVQVWEVGVDGQPSQALLHMRDVLTKEMG
jgi:hypothetical protein